MASVAIDDVLECRHICQLNDQISVNVFHYKVTAVSVVGGTPVTTADCAAGLANQFNNIYAAALPTVSIYFGAGVRRITPTVTIEDGNNTFQIAGDIAEIPLPAQMCGLFAINTGIGGRAFRGRKYMPFPCITHVHTDTKPTAAYRGLIQTIANAYTGGSVIAGPTTSTADLSPVLKHADNSTTAVTGSTVRLNWGTQRSRGGYGRPNTLPVW